MLAVLAEKLLALARGTRYLPDQMLHPWRRWAAVQQLARKPRPRKALFICHGNICRSPYAAALARQLLPAGVAVESAGFIGPGRPPPPEAVAVARERGIDLTPHRSQLISPDQLLEADVVVVMDQQQRRRLVEWRPKLAGHVLLLGDLDPEPVKRRAVPDPVDKPMEVFRSCYDRVDRCIRVLANSWGQRSRANAQSQGDELKWGSRS